ncbi:hypothetical protein [Xylanimonas protaetiae]|uniref:Uncharacterized protein n=1 Tax=Xylanimonas protaetiae TaxID=2509457 RepID=A0A4P6F121_9MICO|nr:hypothetical protein [Xylanimonas protaetiae]QAY69450.1 hypothetical protein ET471_04850 [Xylanimonas protaetiae]
MPDEPTTDPGAAAPRPPATARGALASTQQRADALTVALRHVLWPALAIVLVIGAQAAVQLAATRPDAEGGRPSLGIFVVYSIMLLAMLPVLVTVGAAGSTALLSKQPLPPRALAVLAGVVTLLWVGWVAGGSIGWLFGVVLGAATAGAATVLAGRWALPLRLLAAVAVAALGAVVVLWVGAVAS